MAQSTKRAGDVTGRQAQILAAKHAADVKARDDITLLTATAPEVSDDVVDLTEGPVRQDVVEVQQGPVVVELPEVEIRVNQTVEDVTIGVGNHYNFYEGQRYRVPGHVAAHLEEKGLVWH